MTGAACCVMKGLGALPEAAPGKPSGSAKPGLGAGGSWRKKFGSMLPVGEACFGTASVAQP